ncbi:MAG: hypothetical protein WC449_05915 [Candidatus Paceibacterota bacterium]
MSRDINQCVPELQEKWQEIVRLTAEIGIEPVIVCTSRTQLEQVIFWLNDKLPVDEIKRIRLILGMPPETSGKKITRTLNSKHIVTEKQPLSRAIDFAIKKNGKYIWNVEADGNVDGKSDYRQVGAIAEELGLNCLDEINDFGHIEVK